MTAAFYTYVQRAVFCDFTGIQLDLDGWKRSKRGYGNIHSRAYWLHVLRFWPISDRVATT